MRTSLSLLLCAAAFISCSKVNTDKPSTPDASVYSFVGDYPSAKTITNANDDATYSRALMAYRFFYPTVSMEATMQAGDTVQRTQSTAYVMSCGPRHQVFTGNSDTPYLASTQDLAVTGPLVVELPPGPFLGAINDHHYRWIADIGLPGIDAGKGGKHLILPPGYEAAIPVGYLPARSNTYKIFIALRSIPQGGDLAAAQVALGGLKIYPLSEASNPSALPIIDMTTQKVDMSVFKYERHIRFWRQLHKVVQEEPILEAYRPMYGMLASLGIEKGKPFAPDRRMMTILERAANAGHAQMLVSAFASERSDKIVWNDRKWEWVSLRYENGDFETLSGTDLEARDRWFAQAIVTSPKMFLRTPGAGSLYWLGAKDNSGAYLDGGKTYKLTIPQPVPQKLFWSVTIYDASTRSQIATEQDKAALRSLVELKDVPTTTPTELYFGPTAPKGKENLWIQTIPKKGWFAYIRLYGPTGPAFDGSWKPGDFEEVK
jgi:hypothetical protein